MEIAACCVVFLLAPLAYSVVHTNGASGTPPPTKPIESRYRRASNTRPYGFRRMNVRIVVNHINSAPPGRFHSAQAGFHMRQHISLCRRQNFTGAVATDPSHPQSALRLTAPSWGSFWGCVPRGGVGDAAHNRGFLWNAPCDMVIPPLQRKMERGYAGKE